MSEQETFDGVQYVTETLDVVVPQMDRLSTESARLRDHAKEAKARINGEG